MTEGEESVLVDNFGDGPFVKILDTLMDHPTEEYTKKDLAEVNDISRQTVYNVWDRIQRLNIVEERRKIGNTTLYGVRSNSQIIQALYQFENAVRDEKGEKDY